MITEKKYTLLVNLLLQVMFVGILLGLFRTALPALSESIFNVPKDSFVFNILKKFDQILFKFKIFRRFAWSVLIIAEKN